MGYEAQFGPVGVKYSHISDLSVVRSFSKTPFLDISMTVDWMFDHKYT